MVIGLLGWFLFDFSVCFGEMRQDLISTFFVVVMGVNLIALSIAGREGDAW